MMHRRQLHYISVIFTIIKSLVQNYGASLMSTLKIHVLCLNKNDNVFKFVQIIIIPEERGHIRDLVFQKDKKRKIFCTLEKLELVLKHLQVVSIKICQSNESRG